MDDALLVGMLDGLADRGEEFEPLADAQLRLVAELGQRQAVDQLHDEERPVVGGHPAVNHSGDVGVLHQGQGLALLLEPLEHGSRIHPRLDQLERDLAFDRLGLLGDPDLAHPPFADLLHERVAAGDDRFRRRRLAEDRGPGGGKGGVVGVRRERARDLGVARA